MPVTIDGTTGVTTPAIINANANGVGNIGSSTTFFNTVFAKATSAQYADVAENYAADTKYPIGTVLVLGGTAEVTQSVMAYSRGIIGTVSQNPAYLMNAGLESAHVVKVALIGRVPCRVVGMIRKGDMLTSSSIPGVATSCPISQYQPGCIIGKAIQDYNSEEEGQIEIIVGRL